MRELNDGELLAAFVNADSQEAFAALVERHVAMVHSAARRQVGEDSLAEEVTQAVFIILAQKARGLLERASISGWLCCTAHFVARNVRKSEIHRRQREQLAAQMDTSSDDAWDQMSPLLDEAVAQLNEADREAIVLRFYQGRSLENVGEALGLNADTAQKRVARALERLRKFFARRGTVLTVGAIGGAIGANSTQAAPPTLAKTVTAVALAKTAVATTSTLLLVKGALSVMAWSKIKTAVAAAAVVAAVATPLVWQAQKNERLNRELADVRAEKARLTEATPVKMPDARPVNRPENAKQLQDEILRLRAQVTRLANEARQKSAVTNATNAVIASTDSPANNPEGFTLAYTNRIANGKTMAAGGWSLNPGMRTFILTQPEIKIPEDKTQTKTVTLNFSIVEASEAFWDQMGWPYSKTDPHASVNVGELSPEQLNAVLNNNTPDGVKRLRSPRIQTGDGIQATMQMLSDAKTGLEIDVMPNIDPGGQFVDLQVRSKASPDFDGK